MMILIWRTKIRGIQNLTGFVHHPCCSHVYQSVSHTSTLINTDVYSHETQMNIPIQLHNYRDCGSASECCQNMVECTVLLTSSWSVVYMQQVETRFLPDPKPYFIFAYFNCTGSCFLSFQSGDPHIIKMGDQSNVQHWK